MNKDLQSILEFIQQANHLSDEEKAALLKAAKDANKELEITSFKLERTEKVKHTTSILLEETIEELEQKRKAVEAQNRELEIESSLERVRTVALSMNKPDDMLEVCRIISEQLELLKVKEIRNVQTAIFYEEKGTYMNYEYYAKHDKTFITETSYTNNKIHQDFAEKMMKGNGEFYITHITGDEVKDWLAYQKTTNVFIDDYLNTASSLNYYWYSLGAVALGISTYSPLNEDEKNLFKRFLKVFELSYRRYLDIEKAIAQAREAQIQLALERVRARTMAMQKSDELAETVSLLFKQLIGLGIKATQMRTCAIVTLKPDEPVGECWITKPDGDIIPQSFIVPYDETSAYKTIYAAWKKGEKFLVVNLSGDALAQHLNFLKKYAKIPTQQFQALPDQPNETFTHAMFFSQGYLFIISNEPLPHYHDIFKRFGAIFQQAYTRFLDLKKAEAQARESQIQLAMERVRARTMAMQRSDELSETVFILFQQFKELGENPDQATIGIINEDEWIIEYWVTMYGNQMNRMFKFSIDEPNVTNKIYNAWKQQKKSLVIDLSGKELYDFAKYREGMGGAGYNEAEKRRVINVAFFSKGILNVQSNESRSAESILLLERFAKVFEQTYTRFLDLQKAEAQAREAQIELSLERVRAKTMAMHNSHDVGDTVATMFDELVMLDVKTNRCGIIIYSDTNYTEVWTAKSNSNGKANLIIGHLDLMIHPMLLGTRKAWKNKESFFSYELTGADLINYYSAITNYPGYPFRFNMATLSSKETFSDFFFPEGAVFAFTPEAIPVEISLIFKRFAGVFGQTYRRYLDLQKAEAQARESQIQLALERVRARTMAMQKSDELKEAAALLFQQVKSLGAPAYSCGYNIWEKNEKTFTSWMSSEDGSIVNAVLNIPLTEDANFIRYVESKQKDEQFFVLELRGERMQEHYQYLKTIPAFKAYFDYALSVGFDLPETQIHHLANFSHGNLLFITLEPCLEFHDVFKRFAAVFEQTYTRFLDLQKAEAQSRESQIQLGLERVRARAMAMQSSNELSELVDTVFKELTKLDFALTWCIINIIDESSLSNTVWAANPEIDKAPESYYMKFEDYPFHHAMMKGWKERKAKYVYVLEGSEKKIYDEYLFNETEFRRVPEAAQAASRAIEKYVVSFSFSNFGGLQTVGDVPLSDANLDILSRFGKVFDLTYTRFNDLKKAEAQTREATIEAALEKVRGRAIAMRTSNDVSSTASMVFTELRKLGINPIRSGVALISKEKRRATLYGSTTSVQGDSLDLVGWVMLEGHSVLKDQYDHWLRKEDYFPVLKGELLKTYYETLSVTFSVPHEQSGYEQYGYFLMFAEGFLFCWSLKPYNETEIRILTRFKAIIDLTFRRYLELQKSEANTKEAVKQAALDRIRADIASMRKVSDLDKITPIIWNELTVLGISFMRCGVFIMDEEQEQIHTFLSAPDGVAIAAFHIPYSTPGNIQDVLHHWKDKKNYINHWDELSFKEFADTLVKQGALASSEQYLQTIPHGGFHLHFLPFLQGMLYVANTTQLGDDEINLIQSVADAFSTAYARYEDFNKLEAAKQQVDKTLVDLKQAQSQLIQAEKMASLGELTAGIAHEIQNPLNFVNNFSEVNKELLIEMKDEINKGNIDEVIFIADDIIANEEKINHHGKRADAIVKGMLQHSRSSTSQKEPTDINALADEYLRLSYHGLRAKNKNFNAAMKTDFDETIGKINIIPQDIGRVLLNLYNNAFYSVNEKKKITEESYQPTVSVHTKKVNDKVILTVMDNGNGIPQKILDKIFQPFFTTKPTGQGTGLGLSLSYDIVKAHGGEIKVETKENEGSEFIIQLSTS